MPKADPLTALETKGCPPHHWYIPIGDENRDGMGHCIKPCCKAKKDFGRDGHTIGSRQFYQEMLLLKSRKGGKNSRKEELVEIV